MHYGINEGDIIYIEDPSGGGKVAAEYLCKKKIKAIISKKEMSHLAKGVFEENEIPVINIDEIDIEIKEDIAIINSNKFEEVYKRKCEEIKKRKVEKLEMLLLEYKNRKLI